MRPESGSVSVVLVAGVLLFCLTALAAADVGAMVVARARAQAGADAAALAAAVNQVRILGQTEDPVTAARALAEANGTRLVRCVCDEGDLEARVEVETAPRLAFLTGWMNRRVRAEAVARVDEAITTYRDG